MLFSSNPVIFDLDDFCEDIMTRELWDNLLLLKRAYPRLKITMFTIPMRCSKAWVSHVKSTYPWLELHYHGSTHLDRDEWFDKTEFDFPYQDQFVKGFKAPWWRMNQTTATALDQKGFMISTWLGQYNVSAERVYRFNDGEMILQDVWYRGRYEMFHSHVQSQKSKDGLPDILDIALKAFPRYSNFAFVSEIFLKHCSRQSDALR